MREPTQYCTFPNNTIKVVIGPYGDVVEYSWRVVSPKNGATSKQTLFASTFRLASYAHFAVYHVIISAEIAYLGLQLWDVDEPHKREAVVGVGERKLQRGEYCIGFWDVLCCSGIFISSMLSGNAFRLPHFHYGSTACFAFVSYRGRFFAVFIFVLFISLGDVSFILFYLRRDKKGERFRRYNLMFRWITLL